MKELYAEGLATHGDPESWAYVSREMGPSVDRGTRKLGIEPRNNQSEVPTPSSPVEGNTRRDAKRVPERPHAVRDPMRAWNLLVREPGDPLTARGWLPRAAKGRRESAESQR